MNAKILPIILCGGNGQRLLPFLKYNSPKQFLNILRGNGNLLQNTLSRFDNSEYFKKPLIIGNFSHRNTLIESIDSFGFQIDTLIFEEDSKNTGPALAAVSAYLKESGLDEQTILMTVPIDHYIGDKEKFLDRLKSVVRLMNISYFDKKVITLSVKKTSSENHYGHLQIGKKIHCNFLDEVFEVTNFVEKPDSDMSSKNILWNSGIYFMKLKTCRDLFVKNAPHILNHCYKSVTEGVYRSAHKFIPNEIILNNDHFSKNTKLSFDQILTMPFHSHSLICTDIGTKWEDVGIWSGIQRLCNESDINHAKAVNLELFGQKI